MPHPNRCSSRGRQQRETATHIGTLLLRSRSCSGHPLAGRRALWLVPAHAISLLSVRAPRSSAGAGPTTRSRSIRWPRTLVPRLWTRPPPMRSRHASSPRRRCGGARGEGLGLGDGGGAEGNGDGGSRGGAGGCGGAGGAGSAGGDGAEPMMLFAVSTEPWGGWPWWSHWRERSSRSLGQ